MESRLGGFEIKAQILFLLPGNMLKRSFDKAIEVAFQFGSQLDAEKKFGYHNLLFIKQKKIC